MPTDSTRSLSALHQALENATVKLGVPLPNLEASAKFSNKEIVAARSEFKNALGLGDPLDIVVCGSMARQEMSGASDFDYLIVAHGLVLHATRFRAFRHACTRWGQARALQPPGATAIFGTVVSATELVEQIGLEFDTNNSLTRRTLLLEEGASLLDPQLHTNFVDVAIGRYLDGESVDEQGVPRFLLNDLSRYWRTIAVDYQAKVWQRLDARGWALRYLKLRISRKLTYVGSLVSLFLLAIQGPKKPRDFLTEQFVSVPPLARLAQLTEVLDGDEEHLDRLRNVLRISDDFVGVTSDRDKRGRLESLESPSEALDDPFFREVRGWSASLQKHLEGLFLDAPVIRPYGRKYLTF